MWNPALVDGPIQVPVFADAPQTVTTDDGMEMTVPVVTGYVDGYHLNVAPEAVTKAAAKYAIEPAAPVRVIAGGETVFLKFPDEETAKSALPALWIEEV